MSTRGSAAISAFLLSLSTFTSAGAQMPLLPVLQNGFIAKGTVVAGNIGSSGGQRSYAGAVSWVPASERFGLAGGFGAFDAVAGRSWPAYGARVVVPVAHLSQDAVGITTFLGIGGTRHDTTSFVTVPLGIGLGWRRGLGQTRSMSVYLTPFYAWSRESNSGHAAARRDAARASLGVDVALARTVGLTLGYEAGGSSRLSSVGGGSGVFGAGISYGFR